MNRGERMSSRLRPVVGAITFSGAFVAGMFAAGSTATAAPTISAGGDTPPVQIAAVAPAPPTPATVPVREQPRTAVAHAPAATRSSTAPLPIALGGPRCDGSQPRGLHPRYAGASVSAVYDQLFRPGAAIPYLDTHVPKALKTWSDWDGHGHTLILLGMYRLDHPSYLVGLDPDSGRVIGTVVIKASHLAGMGFLRNWLFTQDDAPRGPNYHHPMVRRYRIDALRAAMERSAHSGDKVYLGADGPPDRIDAIDFLTVDGDSIYAGNHGNPGPGRMYRYELSRTGHLYPVEGPWSIPPRVQGMVLTPQDFIFSSDGHLDRGQLTVVRRAAPDQTEAPIACVWIPAMPENMTVHHGELFLSFESGTKRYEKDHPVNHITHLQIAPLAPLMALADPEELAAEPTLGGLLSTAVHLPELRGLVSTGPQGPRFADEAGSVSLAGTLADYQARLQAVEHMLGSLGHPTPAS
jgi:hypothetical protein